MRAQWRGPSWGEAHARGEDSMISYGISEELSKARDTPPFGKGEMGKALFTYKGRPAKAPEPPKGPPPQQPSQPKPGAPGTAAPKPASPDKK